MNDFSRKREGVNGIHLCLNQIHVNDFIRLIWILIFNFTVIGFATSACPNPTTTFPIADGFNGSLSEWTQGSSDSINWSFQTGSTPSSNTGPSGPSEGSHYIYIEASGNGTGFPSKTADLVSPCFSLFNNGVATLSFSYHMYGAGMGSLDLEISNDDGSTWTSIWNRNGDQGNQWNSESVDIINFLGEDVKLRFHGVTGAASNGWNSDIALDDINISQTGNACSDGMTIDYYGAGCDGVDGVELDIVNTGDIVETVLEIVYKSCDPGASIDINSSVGVITLSKTFTSPQGGYVFRGVVNGYVTNLDHVSICGGCNDGNGLQSIMAFVERSTDSPKSYAAVYSENGSYCDITSFNINIATGTDVRDIDIVVPISEMTDDGRYLTVRVTDESGTVTESETVYAHDPSLGSCCFNMVELTLENVPANSSFLTVEIITDAANDPSGNGNCGQSWIIAATVLVEVNCCPTINEPGLIEGNQTICNGDNPSLITNQLAASGTGGGISYQWFKSTTSCVRPTGIDQYWVLIPGATSSSYDPGVITESTCYVRAVKEASCSSYNGFSNVVSVGYEVGCLDCVDAINLNGDLEDEGTATNFNLSLESTPALLIDENNLPSWWGDRYNSNQINTATFQGPYYLNKNSTAGDPHSGSHYAFMKGDGICLSALDVNIPLYCGSTYRISVWIAAYTPFGQQSEAPFEMEFFAKGDGLPDQAESTSFMAPASASWNTLNWNQYTFDVTISDNGYDNGDFIFTTKSDVNGILIDDVCIMEVSKGSIATAGPDQFGCSNAFVLNGNTPETGFTGTWSVVSGSANITSVNQPNSTASISSGNVATLRWTVSDGACSSYDEVVMAYENGLALTVNSETICNGESTILTVTGCSGSVLWNTGETTTSITVSPSSTTTYNVSCSDGASGNLLLNPDFESAVDFEHWSDWDNSGITTNALDVHTGTKAGVANASIAWAGFGQDISVLPGESYDISFWAKTDDVSRYALFEYIFYDASWQIIGSHNEYILSNTYTEYNLTFITPPNTAYLTIGGGTSEINKYFVDDISVVKQSCNSDANGTVTVYEMTASIDFNGTICLENDSRLTGIATGGTPQYTYSWTGPNGYTGNTEEVLISENGNYFLTITDDNGCTASTSGFVYLQYEPTITTLQTDVCEGESVSLSVNSASAVSYQWSANAGGGSSPNVTVTPVAPSSSYYVTVTNDLGCTSVADVTIDAHPTPMTDAGVDQAICNGETITLAASTPSNNAAPYTYVWNNGLGANQSTTFVPSGNNNSRTTTTYSVTVTDTNGCTDSDDVIVTIYSLPIANVTHTDEVCEGDDGTITFTYNDHPDRNQILLSINGGANWQTQNDNTASYTFTNLVPGVYDVMTKWSNNDCDIDMANVTISEENIPIVDITGSSTICVGNTTLLSPTSGGTWVSSNTSVATVNNNGLVTAVGQGTATFIFTDGSTGCVSQSTATLTVDGMSNITISGDTGLCTNETTTLIASSGGGTWISSNVAIATINSSGVVTAISVGVVTITYDHSSGSCSTNPTHTIEIDDTPIVTISGDADICVGENTYLLPNTGGTWTSSDFTVATITNNGIVTGISAGTATFVFTSSAGCTSLPSGIVTVTDQPTLTIDYNGSLCLTDDSQLSTIVSGGTAPFTYSWTGPNGFTSTNGIIDIVDNGNYYITITDVKGCTANSSGFVYQRYEPFIINLQTTVCEGDDVTLTVNASNTQSYLWSANAGSSTSTSVVVTPTPPSSTYYVTVTSNLGCTSVAQAVIDVDAAPTVSISGDGDLCVGESTNLLPSSGGVWTSTNGGVAIVSSTGVVTAVGQGTANFVFTESSTGCSSLTPLSVNVTNIPTVVLNDHDLCIGETTTITPDNGGTWTSSNSSVASITNAGVITALSAGSVYFTYTGNSSGCSASTSQQLIVNGKPNVIIPPNTELCIGETFQAFPSVGGTWVSTDPSVATINNLGLITAESEGTVTFIFTNQLTGCASDESNIVTVLAGIPVVILGDAELCIGETTNLSPSTGGTWQSDNPSVATITNGGVVTALAEGVARFKFTSNTTGCQSEFSGDVTIDADPVVSIVGDGNICTGEQTTLLPSTGGVWTSNNAGIATVTASGTVTGVSSGIVTFTFTSTTTSCSSTTSPITVFGNPTISINGPSDICIGDNTNLSPSTGGTWTSSNNSIATVSTLGIVTGVGAGTTTFTFVEASTGCSGSAGIDITVLPSPIAIITGPSNICIGEMTSLSPTTGGYWTSSNPSVASVLADGTVTGLSQGISRFTFTDDNGCSSNQTAPVLIYGKPQIITSGPTSTCVGGTLLILPNTGGTWTSSDNSIATITNGGVITGVSPGMVTFTFVETVSGCTSDESVIYTINETPIVTITGADELCIGETTTLAPTVGGVWSSSDVSIAVVDNTGLVVSIAAGDVTFTFTSFSTGCTSAPSDVVHIEDGPSIMFTGDEEICVGETTTLSPTTGGTWYSTNPAVASITNDGVVTALQQGVARFYFVSDATGCQSSQSSPLTINGVPSVGFSGNSNICIGGTVNLYPSTGGTWVSSDVNIATVTNAGLVTGISAGMASFTYTDLTTGCSSDGLLTGTVLSPTEVSITGPDQICMGGHTTLSPTTGGFWISNNSSIAYVTSSGIVTGRAPGIVTFTFTDALTGCSMGSTTDPVEVTSCFVHDFNVTTTNITLNSTIATNDDLPSGSTYGTKTLIEKPSGSSPLLTVNSDGTYSFSATTPGKYLYNISICIPPSLYGCTKSLLEITVLDNVYSVHNALSDLEIATTYTGANSSSPGQVVEINTLANDDCVFASGCSLSLASVNVVSVPGSGSTSVDAIGNISYTPNPGFVGLDTVYYEVCSDSDCSQSMQIVTVNDISASNSIYAADDFLWTAKETPASGNVKNNDGDAEGDNTTIVAKGTSGSPISITGGTYYMNNQGDFTFTPATGFYGYTEITYTICDDNVSQACKDATIHILVFDDLSVGLRVYLEGAIMNNGGLTDSQGRPMMRDDLRVNPYDGNNYIPIYDPYSYAQGAVLDYTTEYEHRGPGLMPTNQIIADSLTVFSVTGENAIVDWVYVQLRSKDDMMDTLASRSALVQRDGDVVDLDGVSPLRFKNINADSFYVAVKHRSHLGLLSEVVPSGDMVDFTDVNTPVFNYGTTYTSAADLTGLSGNKNIAPGYRALWAGDFNSDGLLKFVNPDDDVNWLFFNVLLHPDNLDNNINFDFAFGYYNGDFDMDGKAKYNAPEDDTNLLFFQLLLHPLNINFLTNYNFFVEHIPR